MKRLSILPFVCLTISVTGCDDTYDDDSPYVSPTSSYEDPVIYIGDAGDAEAATDSLLCQNRSAEATLVELSQESPGASGQPAHVRQAIQHDYRPAQDIAFGQFINFYDFDPPSDPELGEDTVHLSYQAAFSQLDAGGFTLLLQVSAPSRAADDRRPLNLSVVVDGSLSMRGQALQMAYETLAAIASSLLPGDVLSLVLANEENEVLLDAFPITGPSDSTVLATLGTLAANGSGDLTWSLETAYTLATGAYLSEGTNLVLLISDGGGLLSEEDEDMVTYYASENPYTRVRLASVGVSSSPDIYDPTLLSDAAALGDGGYRFIDSQGEASRQFSGERFLSLLEVEAMDVSITLSLPPGLGFRRGEGGFATEERTHAAALMVNAPLTYYLSMDDCQAGGGAPTVDLPLTLSWLDPVTLESQTEDYVLDLASALNNSQSQVRKADAVQLYAWALYDVWNQSKDSRADFLRAVSDEISGLQEQLYDLEVDEIIVLLNQYAASFE